MENHEHNSMPSANIGHTAHHPSSGKFRQHKQRIAIAAGVVILVLGGALYSAYSYGVDQGKKTALKKANSSIPSVNNPLSILANAVVGDITAVSNDGITVKTSAGKDKLIKIDKATKIVKKTQTMAKSDLKVGIKVNAYFSDKSSNIASQITIR